MLWALSLENDTFIDVILDICEALVSPGAFAGRHKYVPSIFALMVGLPNWLS